MKHLGKYIRANDIATKKDIDNVSNEEIVLPAGTSGSITEEQAAKALANPYSVTFLYNDVVLRYTGIYMFMGRTYYYYKAVSDGIEYRLTLIVSNATYNIDTYPLEKTSNKVTTLSASSTDTQYPSAKAVYDNMVVKEIELTGTSGTLTDEQKALVASVPNNVLFVLNGYRYRYNYNIGTAYYFHRISASSSALISLNSSTGNWSWTNTALETTSYKITSITSTSSDTQYPSAKAVYNALKAKVSNITEKKFKSRE